ncbi:RNA polymerase sigma factor [Falsibacillus albus]|uniref:Sigma-70 family RNA polymerase sigma factor n=1 Tax=Falsibacillus albus TaxID=2478915 RepID=A0A3L7JS14_9BACI|nr:sigma-70 family RNA polymerase sigma factor [Falsibacillus albus]RLQ93114.1 sigma-70 family RNA polymerase sigma factor [Falsibacillus albus]
MPEMTEIELYERVRQKHKPALEMLYDRYERLLFSFAYKMTGNAQLAEDVIQEVFIKLWKEHAPYSKEKGKFSSWLITLTRNTALDILRKQKSQESYEYMEKDSLQVDEETPEDLAEWKEKRTIVRKAVADLKIDQQEIIDLFYFKGQTHKEISDSTGLPLGTVKGRIRLALKHLRSIMEKEGGGQSEL